MIFKSAVRLQEHWNTSVSPHVLNVTDGCAVATIICTLWHGCCWSSSIFSFGVYHIASWKAGNIHCYSTIGIGLSLLSSVDAAHAQVRVHNSRLNALWKALHACSGAASDCLLFAFSRSMRLTLSFPIPIHTSLFWGGFRLNERKKRAGHLLAYRWRYIKEKLGKISLVSVIKSFNTVFMNLFSVVKIIERYSVQSKCV